MNNRIDAIYARQSVDKKDSISIESQIEFCMWEGLLAILVHLQVQKMIDQVLKLQH